jgi:hypothetical protein
MMDPVDDGAPGMPGNSHGQGPEPPRPSDEQVLRYLGSAVLLCWNELSFRCQTRILAQANDVIGLKPLPGARSEIVKLLFRHAKA